ncbi:MAG TPA: OFA family MFS transporter [Methylomusa anaerophila]|uniref:Putative MFS-type transporter YhjX n=1 Tax=Methylomusa anaerophila TaxID=1930071 RepID=A0A348AJL3_9FIRM|nr:OFA family MFS transporter [Methylomusa anaerophila]BBB91261.1 putative MFS-type transporter YhjX [Methylomusa anaerophila]HML89745.1 OFA family MFS transporter [Methylomusa anaerophila]
MRTELQNVPNRWLIAIMGTVLQLALGTVYAWSFFQQPIMAANNWTNSQVAWAFSLAIFSLGLAAAWGGINLPKFGPRKLAMTGGALFGAGYFGAAYALDTQNLPLLYLGYGVIGGIGAGLAYVTPVATVAKWFPDKKGFITGMVVMGFGFGALIMAKFLAPFLMSVTGGSLVQVFSYAGTAMLIVTLPAGYFLVNPPPDFLPKGYTPPAVAGGQASQDNITARQCILSGKFLSMWTIFFFNIIAGIMFIGFQSPLLQDLLKQGMDPATLTDPQVVAGLAAAGATLIAVSSVFNGLGRFFWGGLSDKIGRVQAFRFILGTQFVVFVALLFVSNPIIFGVLVCYILLCYGGGFGAMPSFVLDVFGPKVMPVVYGTILTAWGCGGIVGPQIVAFLKDNFESQATYYTFGSASVILFLGLILTFFLSNKKFVPGSENLANAEPRLER